MYGWPVHVKFDPSYAVYCKDGNIVHPLFFFFWHTVVASATLFFILRGFLMESQEGGLKWLNLLLS